MVESCNFENPLQCANFENPFQCVNIENLLQCANLEQALQCVFMLPSEVCNLEPDHANYYDALYVVAFGFDVLIKSIQRLEKSYMLLTCLAFSTFGKRKGNLPTLLTMTQPPTVAFTVFEKL